MHTRMSTQVLHSVPIPFIEPLTNLYPAKHSTYRQWNPSVTINICLSSKSYSKMYGAEPRYNDLRYNYISGIMTINIRLPSKRYSKMYGTEPRYNDLRYNYIPGIMTINIRLPSKSYSKMYGAEPRSNDLRSNDVPGLTMGMSLTERTIFWL